MIPNWSVGAGAFVNTTFVRLTPAKQSRTGFLWNQFPVTMSDWQATVEFSVTGLRNLGGDGFAIWYTAHTHTRTRAGLLLAHSTVQHPA